MADQKHVFPVGTRVVLRDLKASSHLNGRSGIVATQILSSGRYGVDLDEAWIDPVTQKKKQERMSIKPENLEKKAQPSNNEETEAIGATECRGCRQYFSYAELSKCAKCKFVSYCSKECQARHWKNGHKEECQRFRSARKATHLSSELKERMQERNIRGNLRLDEGKFAAAEKEFRAAIDEIAPRKMPKLYVSLAIALEQQGKIQEAKEMLRYTIELDTPYTYDDKPAKVAAHANLAGLLFRQGDKRGALTSYQKTVELDPDFMAAWPQFGQLLQDQNDTAGAIAAYRRYMEFNPNDAKIHYSIGKALSIQAMNEMNNRRMSSSAEELAEWERRLRDVEGYFKKAVELDPDNTQFQESLSMVENFLSKSETA